MMRSWWMSSMASFPTETSPVSSSLRRAVTEAAAKPGRRMIASFSCILRTSHSGSVKNLRVRILIRSLDIRHGQFSTKKKG